jgi:hypothetical protein
MWLENYHVRTVLPVLLLLEFASQLTIRMGNTNIAYWDFSESRFAQKNALSRVHSGEHRERGQD